MVTEINENGVGVLKRLADVENNEIKTQFSSSTPNHKILYNKDCILPVNFIGVFGWNITPHLKKPGRDFINSKFYFEKFPIEILNFENCNGKNYLRKKLLNGINFDFSTAKALILYQENQKCYQGVLCTKDDFVQVGDSKKIVTLNLQCFEVNEQDLIQIEDKIFYSKLNLGASNEIFQTRDLVDVIKNKIISHTNRKAFKNLVSKRDLKLFCEHLKKFSSKDFYEEIAEEYLITTNEAKKYVDEFIQKYGNDLQPVVFQDEVFENIIEHCPNLLEKFEETVSKNWYANNQEKIDAANLKLAEIQKQSDDELKTCVELENEIKSHQKTLDEINNQIKSREDFAAEVENKIAGRIDAAKKNAADFICEMAFANPNFGAAQTSKNIFYRAGKIVNVKDEIEIDDIEELANEIGIEKNFAAYLVAAYVNKVSLLLAGSNARDIADAFSVTLTGKTAAIFDCANVTSLEDLEVVRNSDDEIISVLNPFAPNFIAYLPELVNCGKFILAIYPFVEDLKIEPRSFYNYFLPVFTELVIDSLPEQNISTKYLLSEELKEKFTLTEIPISADKRLKKLKKATKEFSNSNKPDKLFTDFPLAYVRGKEEDFMEKFKDDGKLINKIKEFLGTDNG